MSIHVITPLEAQTIRNNDARAIYLDVRTEQEFKAGHPSGAYNIPILIHDAAGMQPNPEFLAVAEQVLDKQQPILCGCKMGGRSQKAAEMLLQAGFTNISNVVGGFSGGTDPRSGQPVSGWSAAGLPVTAGATPSDYPSLKSRCR